jgi:hypothetical protein
VGKKNNNKDSSVAAAVAMLDRFNSITPLVLMARHRDDQSDQAAGAISRSDVG